MPETSIRLKVCSGCKKEIPRQDCHRNRYGEYICRACQAAGFKFTWRHLLAQHFKTGFRKYALWVAYLVLGILAVAVFFIVLDRFSSAPAPTEQQ